MKKHLVDDLFKTKLTNLERTPSADAWSKIQARQKKGKRTAWVWYAAAGVSMTLMTGYLVWQNQSDTSLERTYQPEVAVNQTKPHRADSTHFISAAQPVIAIVEPVKKNWKAKSEAVEYASKESSKALVKNDFKEPEPEKAEVSVLEKESITEKVSKDVPQLAEASVKPNVTTEETDLTALVKQQENRVIIVKVEEPEDMEKKVSRFSKVFRQLKNARAGERVDWNEVGFNPRTIIARAGDDLRNPEGYEGRKQNNEKQKNN
ncbi:hypothetical protein DYBT9275_04314 [Dyadobacter sp. CECT 9275]|uniref:Uncharacterized protein n=1 Tax=Dyadobacter helix TaxID=2822344 RepID=A0A916JF18_9BACT|nr:hypothetical protein [Dyadobacter sp. CECT 9275]CAG5008595.1 hypothetical protein DYBT9275_04314 [Dyadobacter sp. CECT 9275]